MKIIQHKNIKLIMSFLFLFCLIFSFTVLPNKVEAQDIVINVKTTGYSMLSPNSFVFGGFFSGNIERRGFTTYFEFKENDSNLDNGEGREETIKIVRDTNVEEFNDFYSTPELNLFSNYYFRAVGYFNNNPEEKFYGSVLNLRTGYIPIGASIPFAIGEDGGLASSVPLGAAKSEAARELAQVPSAESEYITAGGKQSDPAYREVEYSKQELVVSLNSNNVNNIVSSTSILDSKINTLRSETSKLNSTIGEDNDEDAPSLLVPCDKNCDFYDIFKLINNVVKFLFSYLVIPLAGIMFAYAGFELVTSGGEVEKRNKAKHIFINVALGLILAAGSFVIVQTVLSFLGYDKSWNWFGF